MTRSTLEKCTSNQTMVPSIKNYLLIGFLASASSAAPLAQAACDRTILTQAADAYIAAQTAGSLTPLQPMLATPWLYTENNKNISTTSSVLSKKLTIDHRRTNYDLVTCATYTELIAATGPYVIGTQIRHGADGKVSSIDTIASTTGSWLFNATKTLEYVKAEDPGWTPLPASAQSSREVIQAAGDAYLDMWSDAHAHEKVPWGTPCVRLEGSAYTGKGMANDSCQPGIPSNHNQAPNTRRRYVIDEEMGSVSVFCVWEHMVSLCFFLLFWMIGRAEVVLPFGLQMGFESCD
ncbi:uncharacterized protein N0V89_004663 [Didymosphaeria variabile]|uniref:DUF8021 domain-containing protein n=1 Tax=Didymosphaeria variabile TaxID=1932322 RepID=A0A9W8XQY9_9PLEO|nr:uncharacterized protein N0V89_004663 [Didymosphaeria variabile]KAJ4356627.1 hypothetical protein N0V89_004663 [Didymosphaeria variabile]